MPRWKFNLGDRVVANDKGPSSYTGMQGTIVETGPGKSEYGVKFDSRPYPAEYLQSWWLDWLSNQAEERKENEALAGH